MAPTACIKCKKMSRKGALLLKCSKCQKPFHDLCMSANKGANSKTTVLKTYICHNCLQDRIKSQNSNSSFIENKINAKTSTPFSKPNAFSTSSISATSSTSSTSTTSSTSSTSSTCPDTVESKNNSTLFSDTSINQANESKLKLLRDSDVFHKSTVSSVVKLSNNMTFNIDKAMSEMQIFFSEKLNLINTSLSAIPALDQTIQGLRESIYKIEDQLTTANSKLAELQQSHASLLSENTVLKDKVTLTEEKVFAMAETLLNLEKQCANSTSNCTGSCRSNNNSNSNNNDNNNCDIRLSDNGNNNNMSEISRPFERSRRHFSAQGTAEGSNSSIIITNIYEESADKRNDVAYAVLASVLPTLEQNDILSTRLLRSRPDQTNDITTKLPRPSPWIIELSSPATVQKIMRAKKAITGFATKDVNISLLDQETVDKLSNSKIFINEHLEKDTFIKFRKLKTIAHNLGFKYVWHRSGNFLVKLRDGDISHVFTSAADLDAILKSSENVLTTSTNVTPCPSVGSPTVASSCSNAKNHND